tara:strand:- start:4050 stop:4376 length:327 start_codon:yes stop_codon:yes gene_type:complete
MSWISEIDFEDGVVDRRGGIIDRDDTDVIRHCFENAEDISSIIRTLTIMARDGWEFVGSSSNQPAGKMLDYVKQFEDIKPEAPLFKYQLRALTRSCGLRAAVERIKAK